MALLSTVYCTVAELQRYLSANAVTDFADHDDDGTADTDVVEDSINEATEWLDFHLRQRYTQAGLAASELVTRWCVKISAKFHCELRGNPPPFSVQDAFDRITALIEQVSNGRRQLPGVALRADLRPTFSNVTIDRRYRRSTVRVTRVNSSDAPTALTQDRVRESPQVFD